MKTMVARSLLVLMISVLVVGPSLAGQATDPPLTIDQQKALAARKKAEEQKAKDEKKAADSAAKKAADDKKNALKGKPKHSDIDDIGNRNINKHSINFTSIQSEIAIGKSAAAEVEKDVQLINDPVITEYVNRIGQNLVKNSDATQFTFTIKVIDSDEVNAFALPGGYFYVNSGLILAADDEAELAGVMAHEIGHVAARHATENNSKGTLLQIASIPAIILTGGVAGTALQEALNLGLPITMFQFSKKAESEADLLGLEYMYKTGYDPAATISFFEKLQAKESPRKVSGLFATHPPTPERIKDEKYNIEKILPDKDQYVVTTSEFDKVKARLAALDTRKPVERAGPSLARGRQGGGRTTRTDPDDSDNKPTTRPDDRTPPPDDRPTLKRSDPPPDTP
ncbi:MAG TPA: M48 family metallopeptidase [Terriglobia bacterium]|nr:M48 family metallopeptidase [Terriglobia bacterium]